MAQENIRKVRDAEGPRVAQDAVEDSGGGTVTSDLSLCAAPHPTAARRPPPAAPAARRTQQQCRIAAALSALHWFWLGLGPV